MLIIPTSYLRGTLQAISLLVALCLMPVNNAFAETQSTLETPNGKVLVFWATWCSACKPALQQFQQANESEQLAGYEAVAVNIFDNRSADLSYLKRLDVTLKSSESTEFPQASKEVRALPWIVMIDAQGNVIADKHPSKSIAQTKSWLESMDALHNSLGMGNMVSIR